MEFLQAYSEVGTITAGCRVANVGRRTHYEWMDSDPVYAADFNDAREAFVESLEEEARRRAHEGVEKGVYWNGVLTATEKHYSDVLLIFLLKANAPRKYRDRVSIEAEVTHKVEESEVDRQLRQLAEQMESRAVAGEASGAG